MGEAVQRVFTVVIVAEFLLGNLSNGSIILKICIDGVSQRKFATVDQILVSLAIFRIGLIWQMTVSWFKILPYLFSFMAGTELRILTYTWILANHFSLWLATILSIFYLFKIASFSWPVFLYLKWRVKKVPLMILLGTLVLLLLNLAQVREHMEDWLQEYERNGTWNSRVRGFASFSGKVILITTVFSIIPFAVAVIAFSLLIFSLGKHLQQMWLSDKGLRDSRTKAHINALKIMVSFLVLYAAYFISFVVAWLSKTHQHRTAHMLCVTIELLYPSTHSCILIFGNSKLRQACLSILRQLRCVLKHKQLIIP